MEYLMLGRSQESELESEFLGLSRSRLKFVDSAACPALPLRISNCGKLGIKREPSTGQAHPCNKIQKISYMESSRGD